MFYGLIMVQFRQEVIGNDQGTIATATIELRGIVRLSLGPFSWLINYIIIDIFNDLHSKIENKRFKDRNFVHSSQKYVTCVQDVKYVDLYAFLIILKWCGLLFFLGSRSQVIIWNARCTLRKWWAGSQKCSCSRGISVCFINGMLRMCLSVFARMVFATL